MNLKKKSLSLKRSSLKFLNDYVCISPVSKDTIFISEKRKINILYYSHDAIN